MPALVVVLQIGAVLVTGAIMGFVCELLSKHALP